MDVSVSEELQESELAIKTLYLPHLACPYAWAGTASHSFIPIVPISGLVSGT